MVLPADMSGHVMPTVPTTALRCRPLCFEVQHASRQEFVTSGNVTHHAKRLDPKDVTGQGNMFA
jgi:hypothetical protein